MKIKKWMAFAVLSANITVSVAGDLTVEGNFNVTSNLATRTLSVTNAAAGTLVVDGAAVFNGSLAVSGSVSASAFTGDGLNVTNLNLAAYVGSNLVWDAESSKLHAAASGPGYTDADAVAAVTSTHLNMRSNRVTNLAAPLADSDAATKYYLRAVLSALPPQGNLSMGAYTNGTPTSFPLVFDE